jgi:hypothetical protein
MKPLRKYSTVILDATLYIDTQRHWEHHALVLAMLVVVVGTLYNMYYIDSGADEYRLSVRV